MKFKCQRCKKYILTRDRRRREAQLIATPPAVLVEQAKVAPAVRCGCGLVTVFMKGES